jgi:hypothetical protein
MAGELEEIDLFVSKAASEVVRMYRQDFQPPKTARVFRETTASAAAVGLFYYGVYHTLIVAPATSNTVAKCVFRNFRYAGHERIRTSGKVPHPHHRIGLRHLNSTPKRPKAWSRSIRGISI